MRAVTGLMLVSIALATLAGRAGAQDDHSNSRVGATPLTVDGPLVAGEIEVAGDQDWFQVPLQAGRVYLIGTAALGPGSDTFLSLFNPTGAIPFAGDDNGGGGLSSRYRLRPNQTGTYFVRVTHATGRTGTYAVGVVDVASLRRPPAPAAFSARATDPTRVELSWSDVAIDESGFRVERRGIGSTAWTPLAALPAGDVGWSDTSVSEATGYEYRVLAWNANGDALGGPAAVVTPPEPPAGLTGAALSTTRVDLSWTDVSRGETGYRVERARIGVWIWAPLAALPADSQAWSDATAPSNQQLVYRVLAVGAGGESASPSIQVDTILVLAPSDLFARAVAPASVELAWADRSDNEVAFRVERRAAGATTPFVPLATLPAGSQTWLDTTTRPFQGYEYQVVASDGGQDSPPSNLASVQLQLEGPTGLTARALSTRRVRLSWQDNAGLETGFLVERDQGQRSWRLAPDTVAFEDDDARPGATHTYRVLALQDNVMPPARSAASAAEVTLPGDAFAPVPAVELRAAAASPYRIELRWVDQSTNESGFRVERRVGGAAFALLADVAAGVTAFADETLTPGVTAEYQVRSWNEAGTAEPSPAAAATTPAAGLLVNPGFETGDARGWTLYGPVHPLFTQDVIEWETVAGRVSKAARFEGAGDGAVHGLRQEVQLRAGALTVEVDAAIASGGNPQPVDGAVALLFDGVVLARHDFSVQTPTRRTLRGTVAAVTAGRHELRLQVQRSGARRNDQPWYLFDDLRLTGSALPLLPFAPGGLRILAQGAGGVELAWFDNSSTEDGFRVERAPAGTSGFVEVGRAARNATRFTDATPRPAGRAVSYRVLATNARGDSPPSNLVTGALPAAPGAPVGLTVAENRWLAVRLAWTAPPGAAGLRVERRTSGGAFTLLVDLPPGANGLVDRAVEPDADYEYRLTATNDAGASPPALVAVRTALAPDLPPPPTNLTALTLGPNQVRLTWSDPSSEELGFRIEYRDARQVGFVRFAPRASVAADTTVWVGDVQAGVDYEFRVVTIGESGISAPSAVASTSTGVLAAPTDLQAVVAAPGWVQLVWQDNASTETAYVILRGDNPALHLLVPVAQLPSDATSFVDRSPASMTEYYYRVVAQTVGGASTPSAAVRVWTGAPPPPEPPARLSARARSPWSVDLSWEDRASGEEGYRVERRRGSAPFRGVATLPANATSWTDTALVPRQSWEYRVLAVNAGGTSTPAEAAAVTPAPAPPWNGDFQTGDARCWTVGGGESARIRDHDVDGDGVASLALELIGEVEASTIAQVIELAAGDLDLSLAAACEQPGARVELRLDGELLAGQSFAQGVVVPARAALRATRRGLLAGPHQLRVTVRGRVLLDDLRLSGSAVPPAPPAPTGLGIVAAAATRIDLAWADAAGETGYRIERSPLGGGGFAEVGRVGADEVTFSDTAVERATGYDYRVVAIGVGGDSPPSAVVRTPLPGVPFAPTGLLVSTAGPAPVTLAWVDRAGVERGYRVERRAPGAAAWTRVAELPANSTAWGDLGAGPLAAWEYRVIAWNDAGEGASAPVGVIAPAPRLAPNPATGLQAVATGAGVQLTWVAPAGPAAVTRVERWGPEPLGVVALLPGAATSWVDTTAEPGQFTGYRVVRSDGQGDSAPSNEVAVTPLPRPPAAAQGLRVGARGPYRVALAWQDRSDEETGYRVERRRGTGSFAAVGMLPPEATGWLDESLLPGATWEYRVISLGTGGLAGAPSGAALGTTPPAGVLANGDFETGDLRGWEAVVPPGEASLDVVSADVDGDGVPSLAGRFRRVGHGQEVALRQQLALRAGALQVEAVVAGALLAETVSLVVDGVVVAQHRFQGAAAGVHLRGSVPQVTAGSHELRVVVQRGFLPSDDADILLDDLRVSGTAVVATPSAPTGLTAARVTGGVLLRWTDTSPRERAFRIERSSPGGGSWAEIGRTGFNTVTFTDSTAAAGLSYDYRVLATNEAGDSLPADPARVR